MEVDFEKKVKYPFGFRFVPKDEELVEYYLLPRLQGRPTVANDAVVEANVYACHPDTLTSGHKDAGAEEWYFLSPRSRMYANGVRPARKTLDGRGRWKASTAAKEVVDEGVLCNGVKFCKSVLNYFEGSPRKEARTKWIMLEITVPEYEIKLNTPRANMLLDDFVMCKIYVSPQHKKKGDEEEEVEEEEEEEGEEEGTGCPFEGEGAASMQHSKGATEPGLLEKQAGKRPMIEPPQREGDMTEPARKQARQESLSIGSTQASYSTGSGAASTTEPYFGVVGPPYGLQRAPPMQRPPGAYNSQPPANPPVDALGGQRLAQLPTPTPVRCQPFSDATDDTFYPMAILTQSPDSANQPAGPPCFPGNPPRKHPGTAFRPKVSLQCCYDQNYQAVQQPPGNGSSSSRLQSLPAFLPPQQAQQPFLNGEANPHGRAAAVPRGPFYSYHPYQRSSLAPAADGHYRVANGRNGAARLDVNAEQYFTDLAKSSARPQPASDGYGRAANERNGAARLDVNAEQYFTDLAKSSARPQPASDGYGRAANERNVAARLNVNAEKYFVDLAKISARPQAAADAQDRAANASNGAARLIVNDFVDLAKINPSMAGVRPQPAPACLFESPAPAPARAAKVETETAEMSSTNTQDAV